MVLVEQCTICVGACIGHAQDSWSRVLLFEILVIKHGPIDGLPASAIPSCEVASLSQTVHCEMQLSFAMILAVM